MGQQKKKTPAFLLGVSGGVNAPYVRSERFYGKAERRFALPVELDEARADARFNDGVLELVLPKKAPVAGRKIQVN